MFDDIINTIIERFGHFKPVISKDLDFAKNSIIFCMNKIKDKKEIYTNPEETCLPFRFYDIDLVVGLYKDLFLHHAKELEVYTELDGEPITELEGRQWFLERQIGILMRDPEWFGKIKGPRYTTWVEEALHYLVNLRKREKRTSAVYKDVETTYTILIGHFMSAAMLANRGIPFSKDAFKTPVTLDVERDAMRVCIREIMEAKEIDVEEAWKIFYHYIVFWGLNIRSKKETILKEI